MDLYVDLDGCMFEDISRSITCAHPRHEVDHGVIVFIHQSNFAIAIDRPCEHTSNKSRTFLCFGRIVL